MRTFESTPADPGPDRNDPREWVYASAGFELRETSTLGKPYRYLEGLAVPFGVDADIGWFVESHAAGSFEQTTRAGTGRTLSLLIAHDNKSLAAVAGHSESWTNGRDGLRGVWKLNESPSAQQAAALADNGDLLGLSIGFQPIRSQWTLTDDFDPDLGPEHKDRVTRLESRLLEVSITPTPAFADAQITKIRQRSRYSLETRSALLVSREVEAWRRRVDETRDRWSARA